KGPDHKASIEPNELMDLINSIRNVEESFGDGLKRIMKSECEIKKVSRKSIVARCDIPKGTKIQENMLAVKRPGTGIEPKYFTDIVGKKSSKVIKKEQMFGWGLIS
ncbi:MAG: SAF domain-containing protein, partial [Candidatus Omnitrophica bacterium]|nr:SAF domain-containing protein [Candidatus Omnitrophota bacterium]